MPNKPLFTDHARDYLPLSAELARLSIELRTRVSRARDLEDMAQLNDAALAELIADIRPEVPRVGPRRPARSDEDGPVRRDVDSRPGPATVRQWVAYPVTGEHELLRRWPDNPVLDHPPVDERYVPGDGLRHVDHAMSDRFAYVLDHEPTWSLVPTTVDTVDGRLEWALYTYIDLTLDEEEAVAQGELDVRAILDDRRSHIDPIVTAIAAQVDHYFDVDLPATLEAFVEGRRRTLTNRKAVIDSLTIPDEWKAAPPAVTVDPIPAEPDTPAHVPATDPAGDVARDSVDVVVEKRARLSPVTFEGVLRTMRAWANAIERTPLAFDGLHEDRFSDLLVATLNATMPGAHREVYSQNGKSDIFIEADKLSEDLGPAKVFVCEAKKATSHSVIAEAVDPQLFGYLNVHDTSAVILILVQQQDLDRTRDAYTAVLESVAGYRGTRASVVEGWPLLTYENAGRTVDVCAAFVHVRRTQRRA
ncbi:hypothetical protein GCM10008944_20740 [Cytobacillus oceanisediminis]